MALLNVVHYIRYFATTQLYTVFVGILIAAIFAFAWKSATRRPLNYYGWLVRLDVYSHRRYLDVMPIRPSQPLRRSSDSSRSEDDAPSTSRRRSVRRELPMMSTSTVVIQTPATVMTHHNQIQDHDNELAYHQLELPPSQGESEDAEQIHRYISERTNNPSVATAVVMALVHNNSNRGPAEPQEESPLVADSQSQQHRQIFLSQIRSNTEDGQGTATVEVEDVFLRFGNSVQDSAESEGSDTESSDDESDTETSTSNSAAEENEGVHAVLVEPQRPPTPIPAPLQMPSTSSSTSVSATFTTTSTVKPTMSSSSGDSSSQNDLSTIRLKFLDDTQRNVRTWLNTTVGEFKKSFFTESVDSGRVVRLIYQGQLLRDDARSLQSYGLHDDCVVHCQVGSVPYAQPQRAGGTEDAQPTPETMVNEPSPSFVAILSTGSIILRPILAPFFYCLASLFHVVEPYIHQFMAIPSVNYVSSLVFEYYRRLHNMILGPTEENGENVDEVAAASDRAANSMRISLFRPEAYLGTLFTVKIAFLWSFVVFYPQYTDREAIILLLLVTVFFVSYIRCSGNRTPAAPPTN